jgi:predicted nucleic acid-binding protein
VTAPDTSVVVAAFASWHEHHALAHEVLERRPPLLAPVAVETYSVLTRLPPPHRLGPHEVLWFLEDRFRDEPLALPASATGRLLAEVGRRGIVGGATYDALVAETARHFSTTISTIDRRAATTYRALGAEVDLLL